MGRFGHFPSVGRLSERDKLVFFAALGLVISLLVVLFVVVNYKSATAKEKNTAATTVASTSVGTVTLFTTDSFIRAGTPLSEYTFRDVYWPRNSVPEGAVRDLSELKGKYAKSDIPPGTPVQTAFLTGQQAMVVLSITPGMRAVTIEVDSKSGLEGWALPGTRVDVALTHTIDKELTSKVIVQNARILSSGGESTPLNERLAGAKKAKSLNTVTLEASPADALKIATSRQLGNLSLLMRAPEDDKAPAVTEINENQIETGSLTNKGKEKNTNCDRGVMRIDGKEYMIDCDGKINQMMNSDEP